MARRLSLSNVNYSLLYYPLQDASCRGFFSQQVAGLFHLPLSFDRFLSYASLCRHEGLAVVTFNAIFSRMRTRALQTKRRKLVTPSTPATDYQAVAAADGSTSGSTSGSTNALTGIDT
jgi:hypothetical protein